MKQIVIVEKDGMSRPHFQCEHCGKIIEDASTANLAWNPDEPNETSIICKAYACEEKQERKQGGQCWQPLDAAWVYLGNNSGINHKSAAENAKLLSSIR